MLLFLTTNMAGVMPRARGTENRHADYYGNDMSTATRGDETGETWTSPPPKFVEIANRRLRLCNLKQERRCTMPQARWSGFNLRLNDRDL